MPLFSASIVKIINYVCLLLRPPGHSLAYRERQFSAQPRSFSRGKYKEKLNGAVRRGADIQENLINFWKVLFRDIFLSNSASIHFQLSVRISFRMLYGQDLNNMLNKTINLTMIRKYLCLLRLTAGSA